MIRLNLLSDREKERERLEGKIGRILRTGLSAIFVLVLLFNILVSAQLVLNIYLKSAQEESSIQSGKARKGTEDAEKLLKELNAVSDRIEKTSKDTPRWTKIFGKISEMLPGDIRITAIHAEKEHLKLIGFSKSRESFLNFQQKLQGEGFQNLVSPVSNLVSPENFNFTVEVDIDKKYLSQP